MSVLRVHLFGKFDACYGDRPVAGLDTRKVRELICYLLLYRDRPHPREALASLLWDENHTDQPVRCLRKTLWQLRTALDSQLESLSDHVFLIEPEWVQLSPEADLWLDVAQFEQTFIDTQGILGKALEPHQVHLLRNAIGLYRGGLLESWYQDWYLYERERLQHMYLIMLDKLMGYCEASGEYEAGLVYGACMLRCENAHERTHRRLMRLHYVAGDRTAALRQYEHCVVALREELGVRPAKRTLALYEQIRSDQPIVSATPAADVHRVPSLVDYPFLEMMVHLKQFQVALTEVQRELNRIFETWSSS
jgi:DNA-binding SARP family transcriptional activator